MARLQEIVIDALDPPRLARFWAAALDGYAVRPYDEAEIARLATLGRSPATDPSVAIDGPGPTIFFQETTATKSGRSRIHLDLVAEDRSAEIDRLLVNGAALRDHHDTFSVLLDPEGNEFCVQDAK